MGCRTGFYLIMKGKYNSVDIVPYIQDLFRFIIEFEGEIPGATAKECGNFQDMDLTGAKKISHKYFNETLNNISPNHLNYPI